MNALLAPRVKETSTTTGTGTLDLDGAASGFQTFVAGFGTGNQCYYTIVHGTAWEVGIGTVTDAATDTLSRDTVLASSAGGAKLNLGAGTKTVFCDVTREAVTVPQGHLYGCTMSNNAGDATNDIDFAAGQCASDDADPDDVVLIEPAALTKRLDAVWASGSGQGGRLSSDALANGTWHCFAFTPGASPDDYFFSTSVNPMPPAGTKKRRVGSILREGGSIVAFHQSGHTFMRDTPILGASANNPGTSAVTRTLHVPTGIVVEAILNAAIHETAGTTTNLYLSPLDSVDLACSETAAPGVTVGRASGSNNIYSGAQARVKTNTSAQIRTRVSTSGAGVTLYLNTLGWVDFRNTL